MTNNENTAGIYQFSQCPFRLDRDFIVLIDGNLQRTEIERGQLDYLHLIFKVCGTFFEACCQVSFSARTRITACCVFAAWPGHDMAVQCPPFSLVSQQHSNEITRSAGTVGAGGDGGVHRQCHSVRMEP
jgi:hypothetical protein